MKWNGHSRPTRRHILTLFGMTASVVSVSAVARGRLPFLWNTAADLLYGLVEPRSSVFQASEHPIRYYVSLPRPRADVSSAAAQPKAVVISIDGSDRDFWGYHAMFVRARRDLPFALVTPFVVSNGGPPHRSDYEYSADVFNAAIADPLAFDVSGLSAIIRDLRGRLGSGLPIYLTGFSAGGHLTWLFLRLIQTCWPERPWRVPTSPAAGCLGRSLSHPRTCLCGRSMVQRTADGMRSFRNGTVREPRPSGVAIAI